MSDDLLFSSKKSNPSPSNKKRKKTKKEKKASISTSIPTPPTSNTTSLNSKTPAAQSKDIIFAWGWNGAAACGTDLTKESLNEPTRLESLEHLVNVGVRQIACGPFHTTVLDKTGTVFVFGQGGKGQIGSVQLNEKLKCQSPTILPSLNSIRVSTISCGAYHTIVVDQTYRAFSMGSNEMGQLGHGCLPLSASEKYVKKPTLIEGMKDKVKSCDCGFDFTLLLHVNGKVSSFGNGNHGQLGIGYDTDKDQFKSTPSPTIIRGLIHVRILQVSAGDYHSLFLTSDGRVFSNGKTAFGRLGHGQQEELDIASCTPKRIVIDSGSSNSTSTGTCNSTSTKSPETKNNRGSSDRVVAAAVFAGAASSFIITSSSNVYCFGCNSNGMLGLGHDQDVYIPTKVMAFNQDSMVDGGDCENDSGLNVRSIGIGSEHCLFLTWSGNVYGCGNCSQGRLGLGKGHHVSKKYDPHLMDYFASEGYAVDSISVGGAHSFALVVDEDSTVVAKTDLNADEIKIIPNGSSLSPSFASGQNIPSAERTVVFGVGNRISSELSGTSVVQGPLPSNEWHEVIVRTRDCYGKDCQTGRANVTVSISTALTTQIKANTVTVSSMDYNADGWASGASIPCDNSKTSSRGAYMADACSQLKVSDVRDGTYRILFHVNFGGRIELEIKLNNYSLYNSPFLIEIQKPIVRPVKFIIQNDPSYPKNVRHVLAGERLSFQIESRSASDELACIDDDLFQKNAFVIEIKPPKNVKDFIRKKNILSKTINNKDGTYHLMLKEFLQSSELNDPYLITVRTSIELGNHECIGSPLQLFVSPNEIDPSKSTIALESLSSDVVPLSDSLIWRTHTTYKYVLNCFDRYNNIIQGRLSDELMLNVSISGNIETKGITIQTDQNHRLSFSVLPLTAGKGHLVVSTPAGRFCGTPMSVEAASAKSGLDGGKSRILLDHSSSSTTTVGQKDGNIWVRCGNGKLKTNDTNRNSLESERYSVTGSGALVETDIPSAARKKTNTSATSLLDGTVVTKNMLCEVTFIVELIDVLGKPYTAIESMVVGPFSGADGNQEKKEREHIELVSLKEEEDYQCINYRRSSSTELTVNYMFDATNVVSNSNCKTKRLLLSLQVDGIVLKQMIPIVVLPQWLYDWRYLGVFSYNSCLPFNSTENAAFENKDESVLLMLVQKGTKLWTGTAARMCGLRNDVYCLGLLQAWISALSPPFGLPSSLIDDRTTITTKKALLFKLIVDRLRVPLEDEQGVSFCSHKIEVRMSDVSNDNFCGASDNATNDMECWCKRTKSQDEEEPREYQIHLNGKDSFELLFLDLDGR
jgi:alpha-tubulin suppressor-like RCC1 family protein